MVPISFIFTHTWWFIPLAKWLGSPQLEVDPTEIPATRVNSQTGSVAFVRHQVPIFGTIEGPLWKLSFFNQWIGLRENLQESPRIHGKIHGVSCNYFPQTKLSWFNSWVRFLNSSWATPPGILHGISDGIFPFTKNHLAMAGIHLWTYNMMIFHVI